MAVHMVDKRNTQPQHLCLKHLAEGDTFEFLDHNGHPYLKEEIGHGHHGPLGICRVCFRNSRYLTKLKPSMTCDIHAYNLKTGKIHRRNGESRVCRVDVEITILGYGSLTPLRRPQDSRS